MIEQLTIEKLKEYEFPESFIDFLMNNNEYECSVNNNKGSFWASNSENTI